jgi:hypothetical protein
MINTMRTMINTPSHVSGISEGEFLRHYMVTGRPFLKFFRSFFIIIIITSLLIMIILTHGPPLDRPKNFPDFVGECLDKRSGGYEAVYVASYEAAD